MAGKNKRAAFAEDVQASTGGEIKRILPSAIIARHEDNTSRWACYDAPNELRDYFDDAKICFTLEQIEARLASLLAEGQIDLVDVSISGTGKPVLVKGFLRHCAFLLAEKRGLLDSIPGAKGMSFAGVKAQVVSTPKSQADYAALARRNLAENRTRQDMSPVDLAFYCKRRLDSYNDDGTPVTKEQVADEVDLSKRSVELKLQLLSYRPPILLAVHTGTLKESAAHRQARETGEGTAKGSRKGASVAGFARALEYIDTRPLPKVGLKASDLPVFLALLAGETPDEVPDNVREVFDAFQPSRDEISALREKAKSSAKDGEKRNPKGQKAPPKIGEKAGQS